MGLEDSGGSSAGSGGDNEMMRYELEGGEGGIVTDALQ